MRSFTKKIYYRKCASNVDTFYIFPWLSMIVTKKDNLTMNLLLDIKMGKTFLCEVYTLYLLYLILYLELGFSIQVTHCFCPILFSWTSLHITFISGFVILYFVMFV